VPTVDSRPLIGTDSSWDKAAGIGALSCRITTVAVNRDQVGVNINEARGEKTKKDGASRAKATRDHGSVGERRCAADHNGSARRRDDIRRRLQYGFRFVTWIRCQGWVVAISRVCCDPLVKAGYGRKKALRRRIRAIAVNGHRFRVYDQA